MKFEYDENKSKANKVKHGIDFKTAQDLWLRPIVEIPSRQKDEPRKLVIGHIKSKYWTAIITERKGTVRLISVRRSRGEEKVEYEKSRKNNERES